MTELQQNYRGEKITQAVVNNGQQSAVALAQNIIFMYCFSLSNEIILQFSCSFFLKVCVPWKMLYDEIEVKGWKTVFHLIIQILHSFAFLASSIPNMPSIPLHLSFHPTPYSAGDTRTNFRAIDLKVK